MIQYALEVTKDGGVNMIVRDTKKGLTYSRTPLTGWYKHISISDFLRKEG